MVHARCEVYGASWPLSKHMEYIVHEGLLRDCSLLSYLVVRQPPHFPTETVNYTFINVSPLVVGVTRNRKSRACMGTRKKKFKLKVVCVGGVCFSGDSRTHVSDYNIYNIYTFIKLPVVDVQNV